MKNGVKDDMKLYLKNKSKSKNGSKTKYALVFVCVSLLLSAALSVVALASSYYGNAGRDTNIPLRLFVCLAIGFTVSLVVTSVMKGKLRTVRKNDYANYYIEPDGFSLTVCDDVFRYKETEKRRIQRSDDD